MKKSQRERERGERKQSKNRHKDDRNRGKISTKTNMRKFAELLNGLLNCFHYIKKENSKDAKHFINNFRTEIIKTFPSR